MAVKVKAKELKLILGLLLWRSAIGLTLSAILISTINFDSIATVLLVVAFPQSSCSFIPYAQMTLFDDAKNDRQLFNRDLALSLLAISLPFSSFTIISIYSAVSFFTAPINLIALSAIAFLSSFLLLKAKTTASRSKYSMQHL